MNQQFTISRAEWLRMEIEMNEEMIARSGDTALWEGRVRRAERENAQHRAELAVIELGQEATLFQWLVGEVKLTAAQSIVLYRLSQENPRIAEALDSPLSRLSADLAIATKVRSCHRSGAQVDAGERCFDRAREFLTWIEDGAS